MLLVPLLAGAGAMTVAMHLPKDWGWAARAFVFLLALGLLVNVALFVVGAAMCALDRLTGRS